MAKDEDEHEGRGFKVQDRRRFVDTDDATAATASDAGTADAGTADAAAAQTPFAAVTDVAADTDVIEGEEGAFGEMTFSTFVMGLTTQALMHLGEIPDPVHQG